MIIQYSTIVIAFAILMYAIIMSICNLEHLDWFCKLYVGGLNKKSCDINGQILFALLTRVEINMHQFQSCGLEWLSIVPFKITYTLVLSYLMLEFAQRFKIFSMYILQTRCHEIINLMQLVDFYSSYIQMVWKGNYILNIQMYVQWGKKEYS